MRKAEQWSQRSGPVWETELCRRRTLRWAKFSPGGKHFVAILKKGNLETNTKDYSVFLFRTAEVFQSPEPQVLVSLASSGERAESGCASPVHCCADAQKKGH
jgi:hypothetical protein